jgi:Na+/proline symporter
MALVSYTMIGASLAPALMAAFFWKRVTRSAGVASIAAGMLTVLGIVFLNFLFKGNPEGGQVLGIHFPIDMDYISLPAVMVSTATLIVVSLLTEKPQKEDWAGFIES